MATGERFRDLHNLSNEAQVDKRRRQGDQQAIG